MKQRPTRILVAAAVRDAAGVDASPGAVAIRDGVVVAAGDPEAILADPQFDPSAIRSMPGMLLIPALVNAHAHLELTLIGPKPYDADRGFVGWVGDVLSASADLDRETSAAIGAEASLDSGVCAVGDIASSQDVIDAVRDSGLHGQSYLELFGLGEPYDAEALQAIEQSEDGALQPHAPYSAGPRVFDVAARSGRPVCTHLAELLEEHRFVRDNQGPFGEFIRQINRWNDDFANNYTGHASSVQWMRPYLEQTPWLLAHCNYISDDDLKLLADTNASVAYCPIASDYFGHSGHRYRDMLDAGINVCLGTDSILCQPPDETHPLGILPQMRYLFNRDRTDPQQLLEMATINGAKALRLPKHFATFQNGALARVLAIPFEGESENDPLTQVLLDEHNAEVIHG